MNCTVLDMLQMCIGCVLGAGVSFFCCFFVFNDTATTEIYTLSLHDALPICPARGRRPALPLLPHPQGGGASDGLRSEERFSRNAETDIVCRLLLEKKK